MFSLPAVKLLQNHSDLIPKIRSCSALYLLHNFMQFRLICCLLTILVAGCKEKNVQSDQTSILTLNSTTVNGKNSGFIYEDLDGKPLIKLTFSSGIDPASIKKSIFISDSQDEKIDINISSNEANSISIQPENPLVQFSEYKLSVLNSLVSITGGKLQIPANITLRTALNSTDKFARIADEDLLTLVQKQTFKYFWDFGHPVSGLIRERNTSGDVVTSGGSGFGIMTIPVGIERAFITRAQGLERMQKIVGFLKNNTIKFHGAFPHWLNGATGTAVPFSAKDDGADLVETSFLIQGLLTARQYFDQPSAVETALRFDINSIWHAVEWDWFRQGNQDVLYWHWSPNYGWDMNLPIRGWNECLITYVLAASSPTHAISKSVYEKGWTENENFINGKDFSGVKLPLGTDFGGPLFFAHYSFLGINPNGLTDKFSNYLTQNRNHTLINYNYCKANPKSFYGYSEECWGLTASDVPDGYNANSPTNDNGVISPTAALASFPYTPEESMKALKFFYYKLGDKLWGDYGFYDAFSLSQRWFANSTLAIDQGPIIVMIENHRTGLIWNRFMSSPEIKEGMKKIGFQSPSLN